MSKSLLVHGHETLVVGSLCICSLFVRVYEYCSCNCSCMAGSRRHSGTTRAGRAALRADAAVRGGLAAAHLRQRARVPHQLDRGQLGPDEFPVGRRPAHQPLAPGLHGPIVQYACALLCTPSIVQYVVLVPARRACVGALSLLHGARAIALADIVDMKPPNMEDLTEVITAAEFHPSCCGIFAFASSKGSVRLCDMRVQALCDKHVKCTTSHNQHIHITSAYPHIPVLVHSTPYLLYSITVI